MRANGGSQDKPGLPWGLVGVLLAAGVAIGTLIPARRLGDASNFVMIADSLWHDGDLRYDPDDLSRAQQLGMRGLPKGLFLSRTEGQYYYSKPFLYSLFAAPFFGLLGVRGLIVWNGLLGAVLLLVSTDILVHKMPWWWALCGASAVLGFSAVPAYLIWLEPYLFLTCLAAGCLAAYRRGWPATVGVLVAALAHSRLPYLFLGAAPAALYTLKRQPGSLIRFAVGGVVTTVVLLGAVRVATGQWSVYGGERYYYPNVVPYETAIGGEPAIPYSRDADFERWHFPSMPELARRTVSFCIGRFTGVFLYYPAVLACLLWARSWDAEKIAWLLAVAATCLALVLLLPANFFGGAAAIGNRYFVILPIALAAVDQLGGSRFRLMFSAPLLLIAVPAIFFAASPGRQALQIPYRYFPVEWAQAPRIPFPFSFPGMSGLTRNQFDWEPPGGVWTVGGSRAEFVLIRPRDASVTVRLQSRVARATLVDGGKRVEMTFAPGIEQEVTLRNPVATARDEGGTGEELSVYDLVIETSEGFRSSARDGAGSRYLGVFVRPMP